MLTCDTWKESNDDEGCASQLGFEEVSVDNHDEARNAVESIQDGGCQRVESKDVEEVVPNIEGLGDVLEPFEVGSKAKSGYAHESIVDPSVGT